MITANRRRMQVRLERVRVRLTDLRVAGVVCGLLAAGVPGCAGAKKDVGMVSPYPAPLTVAVAPALNFSGSSSWDPMQVGDLMASELSQVQGVHVVGVNRVMAVLTRQGRVGIASPAHALDVCRQLGVNAILVFAITEYDPYSPPVVAIAAQLYGPRPHEWRFDPVAASREARPFAVTDDVADELRPWVEVQRTFNAAHDSVQKKVEAYAKPRDAEQSPFGWRKYLVAQDYYLRFCCHRIVSEMMQQESERARVDAVARREPSP